MLNTRPVWIAAAFAHTMWVALTAMPEPDTQIFEDRTKTSGVSFVLRNGASGQKRLIETMTGGVAVLDFDNDGMPDIFFVNGAQGPGLRKREPADCNRLYRNKRNWQFEDVTTKAGVCGTGYGMGVSAADYNNDGFTDLLVTHVEGVSLLRNRGDGSFEDVTGNSRLKTTGWIVAAAWLDFDNDGLLDLFLVHYVSWDPAQEPWCGDRDRNIRTWCHPRFFQSTSNQLYRNEGDGHFTDVSMQSGIAGVLGKGMGVAVADYDHDGRMDIFVANDTLPNFLFHNQGGGAFLEVAATAGVSLNDDGKALSSMGVDIRDVDNDLREDVFITALAGETFPFFHNIDSRLFIDRTYPTRIGALTKMFSGWGAGIFDFDNDGWKDIFSANGDVQDNTEQYSGGSSKQRNLLLLNRQGTWRAVEVSEPALHRGAAFGDLDRDGRVDAVVTRLNDTPLLLRNVSDRAHNWIDVQLAGRDSNSQGIGTRVVVKAGKGTQMNHATVSVGYASSSEPVVHFGLGEVSKVEWLEIRWPSGIRQVLRQPATGKRLLVREPGR